MKKNLDAISIAGLIVFGFAWPGFPCTAQIASVDDWATVQRIVGRIHGVSKEPPANLVTPKFTDGALMGNGDIGVVTGDADRSQQTFRFGKSDFWGTQWDSGHNAPEVSILSFGTLTVSSSSSAPQANFPESGGIQVYSMDQGILHAEVSSTVRMGGRAVHIRSWTADGENVFVTEIWAEGTGGDAPGRTLPIAIDLSMPAPDAAPHVTPPAEAGNENGVLWVSRENDLTGAQDYKARGAVGIHLLGAGFSNIAHTGTRVTGTFTLKDNELVEIVTVFERCAHRTERSFHGGASENGFSPRGPDLRRRRESARTGSSRLVEAFLAEVVSFSCA
jgi:hypothetical protein